MASKTTKYTERASSDKRKTVSKASKTVVGSVYGNTHAGKFTASKNSEMTEEQRAERRKKAALATFAAAYESHNKKR